MKLTRIVFPIVAAAFFCAPNPITAQISPWGISSSASSFKNHAEWFPKMAAAGITNVRLFPEWRGFEPMKGTWNWKDGDALVKSAADNAIEINAILMGSPPGSKLGHAFPMEALDDWSRFVSEVVGRYHKQIHYWEVWNEGNGGFNDGKHNTSDYAKLAAVTFAAAKKADPKAQVGLTVASFDAPYLNQAILAQAKAGKPNSFDYLCIHPYEIADGLANPDGEIPFLWMNKFIRDMLKNSAPERANAELWITEVGHHIKKEGPAAEREAAKSFIKIYTMALAQGISRIQWFEAQDPVGEEQGFGLLRRDGSARDSFKALKTLQVYLGPTPKYVGWIDLGLGGRGYGFVFEGKNEPILIAWMPAGLKDSSVTVDSAVGVIDISGSRAEILKAGQAVDLSDTPFIMTGLKPELLKLAKANAAKNFPWGGDFSKNKTISLQLGLPNGGKGIFQSSRIDSPSVKFADGSSGILVQGDINHPVSFFVHPTFASFQTKEYFVRATIRRVASGNVGMNLIYETADSQGKTPYANAGKWFGATNDTGWQTYTWHVTDACFSKMWGYVLTLRPEQSIPFVIGKIEVSTEAFK